MNRYFVPSYFQDFLSACNYAGSLELQAFACYDEQNREMPHDLLRFDEDTHILSVWDSGWKPLCREWFVVRHNPGFNYPETVISEDGIFDRLADAEEYIKTHGGSWKMYNFRELQTKMAESIQLMQELKNEQEEERPF